MAMPVSLKHLSLKHLSNDLLLSRTNHLVQKERRITLELLKHLKEIDSRRLHVLRGHNSLFTYLVTEHHYSEASALRRVNAMRALRELPELEVKIQEGKLNLTTSLSSAELLET